ncbi:serine/threonine-protein phosphatase 2A regulatory subunit B'' subunit alpha-like [Lethenteron reissneri]|uniref:serine/threonine-protein phosphatase 2A regulatory subunit B'' subunit alpha-like n=1 Tax=Lethenteron reissneri TaxID=7753 RepID=UPI002AB684D3|nr:serine/threonine-protein phosphatase 2A regulatory subunit B'' subunit alpha-like [Lethenteron reissneri]XP_061405102.1 serine/threonine-protein phosphatase 2A regulatory subunit B'' subunit alpha-like [Lethenteron reissneri]
MEDWRQQQLLLSQSLSTSSSLSSLSSLSLSSSSSSSLRPGPPAAYKLVATSVTHFGSARAEACLPSITTPLSRAVHHCVATDNAAKTASTAKTTGKWEGSHGCSLKTTEAQRAGGILKATSQGGHFQDVVGETGGAFPVLAPHCDELQNGCFREGVTPGWCGVASCRVVHRGTCSPATPRIVHSSPVKATAFAMGGGRCSNDDGLTHLFIGSSGDSSDCGSTAPKNNVVLARKSLARPNVAVGTIELASGKIKEFSRQTQQAQANAARRSPRRNKGASDAKAPATVKHASRMKPMSDPETSLCVARPSGRAGPDAAFDLLLPYLRQGLLVRLLEEAGASTGGDNTGSVEQFLSSLFASTTSAPSTAAFSSTEDIRACLQILVKCSEDLKRCTNIIKQCVDEKSQRDGKAVRAGCGSSTPDLHRALPDTAGPEFLAAFLGGAVAAAAAAGFGSIAPPSYEDVVSSSSHPGRPATPLPPNEMPLRRSLELKSSSSSHPTSKFTGRKPSNKTSSLFSLAPSPNSVAIVPPSQDTGADLLLLPTQATSENCASRSVDGGVADNGKLPHMLINSTNMAADFPQLLPAVESEGSIGEKREYDVDQILVELENISKEFSSPSPVKSNAKLDPAKGAKANDRNDNDEDEDKLLGKVLAVMEGLATDLAQCGATGSGARLSGEAQVRAKQDLMGLLMERLTTALQGPESGPTALAVPQERHAHQAAGADAAEAATHLETREESKPEPVLHNHLPHAPDPDPHPPSSRIHSLSSFRSPGESVPHTPVSSTRKSPAPALRGWNSRGPTPQSVLISEPAPPPPSPPPPPAAVVQNSPDPDLQIPIAFAQVPKPASPGREGVEKQGGAAGAVVVISSTVPPAPDSNSLRPGYETRNLESGVSLHDAESAVGFHASLLSSDDDVGKGERFGKGGGGGASSDEDLSGVMIALKEVFGALPGGRAYLENMTDVTKACRCCPYWRVALFLAAHGEETGFVTMETFTLTWLRVTQASEDDAARFVSLLARPGMAGLTQEDFIPLVQDIVDTHPGLAFLKEAPEFHSRYITTVIQRIFYTVNRSWSGRITVNELRRSNFLQTLALVAEEDDINQVTEYFSYEHFYVIYCKFWELDTDHDLYISASDLARHSDGAISSCMIHRIFSGAVTRGSMAQQAGRMSYADFVWFLLSEEDKRTPTSIEYWFRCLDLDGDGVLSLYELEHFYSEQAQRMEVLGIEPLPFCDCVCQMLDLVKPVRPACVTLGDLKRCKMSHIFLDTFFNLEKYLDREQREPFAITRDLDGDAPELSDWERYAMEEYEMLVAKESEADQLTKGTSDEDIDDEDDILAAAELAGEISGLGTQS